MSPPKTIEVKWNKQIFPSVPLPEKSDELKAILRGMTGVVEERQTLMCKSVWKGILASGVSFSEFSWPESSTPVTVILMGTPTEKATTEPPKEKVVFLEDLSVGAAASTGKVFPPGLHNLGNTCYMNSTLQLLKAAPEFENAVLSQATITGREGLLSAELKNLFNEMKKTKNPEVVPTRFVSAVRNVLPRFNEKNSKSDNSDEEGEFSKKRVRKT